MCSILQIQEEPYNHHTNSEFPIGVFVLHLSLVISDGTGPIEVELILQEHKCVLDSCRALEMEGFRVTYLPVQKNGLVDLKVSDVGVRGRVGTH